MNLNSSSKGVYTLLTGKERSYLKSLANNLEPLFQVGKNGLSENFLKQVDEALELREIVKINVLKNCMEDPKDIANVLVEDLNAEFVQSIGRKIVIYRESIENKEIQLP